MYNRDAVGKYHLQVCTTTPCQLCGSDAVMEAVKEVTGLTPGHTDKEGIFTFSEVECLGACANGEFGKRLMLGVTEDVLINMACSSYDSDQ